MLHARLLKYLTVVARAGSIRKAAAELNVASSAVNRQILALERELGTPLFERSRERLRLTAAGQILLTHIGSTLTGYERAMAGIADLKAMRRGRVTIATQPTLASAVLPRVLDGFAERHPHTTTVVLIRSPSDLVAAVQGGEADLGFGFGLPDESAVQVIASLAVPIGAVVSPGHPLAKQRVVDIAMCLRHRLILPEKGLSFQPVLDELLQAEGNEIEAALVTNSVELMKQSAARGLGVAFLTLLNVHEECRRGELVFLPLRQQPIQPKLCLVHRARTAPEGLVAAMSDSLCEALKSITKLPR